MVYVRAVRMETLRQTLEMVRRHADESDHVVDAWEGEDMVRGLIRDYESHRERVGLWTASTTPSGDGVGGLPQPFGATPLTSP